MIIDGRHIAEDILAGLGDTLRGKKLGIVASAGNPATESYIARKSRVAERLGVEVVRGRLEDISTMCDAVLIQLPHPDADTLIPNIPGHKDVDALGDHAQVQAPVAEAVKEILMREGVGVANKKVVVVGEGRLVGKPAADMLRGMDANVVVVTLESGSLAELKDADIVVSGAGSPHFIKPEMLKHGVVLIDAGTSEQAGRVVGDCDPSCAEVASVFTPVPGGIGPIAVAMLFKNFARLSKSGTPGD
jgi:5,10-methylene-tetrahydrofolate dehydrogenase/methenyl tetrahydrofolate cyclohydrolase